MYDAVLVDISTMDHWQWSLDTKLHTDLTAKVVRVLRSERTATKKGFKRLYRRGYEFSNSSLFTRMHCISPECIAPLFYQSTLYHEEFEDVRTDVTPHVTPPSRRPFPRGF